jgi:hypothetical protein
MHSKKIFTWAASSLFITFTSITSFDVRLSVLLKAFGATAFISATTFASCPRSHMNGRTPIANAGGITFVAFSMPWQRNVFWKNLRCPAFFVQVAVPLRKQCKTGHILAVTNTNKLALEHRLCGTNLGLGIRSSLPLPLLPLFVHAMGVLISQSYKAIDRQAVCCNLVILNSAFPQSGCNFLRHFKAPRDEQLKVASVLVH